MRHGSHHCPKQTGAFNWTRIPETHGTVKFRLYRRDLRGVLHISYVRADPIMMARDRRQVAQWLRSARHKLRDMVDEIDIAILEQESSTLG